MFLLIPYAFVIFLFFKGLRSRIPSREILIYAAAVLLISNLCALLYSRACEFIYYWDNASYWMMARDVASGSLRGGFWHGLYNSILNDDYNYLAALMPAVFAKLFGGSRSVYIFAVTNCCFVPTAVMIRAFTKSAARAAIITAALPVLLFLALTGFVDVFGCALCLGCILLSEKYSWRRGFAIGGLLVAAILFRRWYAFFAVSFLVGMFARCIIERKGFLTVLVAGAHSGFILLAFFMPLVTNKLLVDYSVLYASYKYPLMTDIRLFGRYFGLIFVLLLAGGAVYCLIKKDTRAVTPLVQAALCFMLFIRTQTHGQQHLLLYVPAAAAICSYSLEKTDKKIMAAAAVFAAALTFNTFIDRPQPQSLTEIDHVALIPDFSMRGRKRDDAWEILALKNELDRLYGDSTLAVNLSSLTLNPDVLKNVQPSLNVPEHDSSYIIGLPAIDSRDTDLEPFYTQEYILNAYPAQIHLTNGEQRTTESAALCLNDGIAFGAAYQREPEEFEVDGVKLYVYRRYRDVTEAEKAELWEMIH